MEQLSIINSNKHKIYIFMKKKLQNEKHEI